MSIDQGIGGYTVPFGKYKIDSCKKQDDLRYKEIIAYDKLAGIDINVADWYNGLFPTGMKLIPWDSLEALSCSFGIEK